MKGRWFAALGAAMVMMVGAGGVAQAAAPVPPYRTGDYAGGGFHDVLPPGTNGLDNGPQLLAYEAGGQRPPHNDDQLAMYRDLIYGTPGLTAAGLTKYYKDSSFGVRPDDVASTVSPRDDVTIVRDQQFGVPHIFASTRAGAMFGEGYAAAQDRLFMIDVLRHLGRAQLSSFAGGSPSNREMDAEQWAAAPYTEDDLQRQIDGFAIYGAEGAQLHDDLMNYVAGINEYISEARLDPTKMPGEYAAINKPLGPDDWKGTDVIATASLVGAIFGKGGGRELDMALFLQRLQERFGAQLGRKLWYQLAAYDDPDAPTTVKGKAFPYQLPPDHPAAGGEVLPDPGSLKPEPLVVDGGGSGAPGAGGLPALPSIPGVPSAPGGGSSLPAIPALPLPKGNSNALLVSAADSQSGHPLAVFGPQVGYFAPQILMEQDVHAPTVQARGASFPGTNLFVELGHGGDYAWSATSAGQDIIDSFVVPTCQDDMHYLFRGQCLPVEVLERTNTWVPNAADQTSPGSETLRRLRTKLGIVQARGTVAGKPVLFTSLRSTYFHEVDSARGFSDFNNPDKMKGPADFQKAAAKIGYTFNWFYADDKHTAYFNSGNNPLRAPGTTGQLPMDASKTWQGWDPDTNIAQYTPFSQHPQAIDQDWMTSWNNRQAAGYAGSDDNLFSSVFRSMMLDRQIEQRLRGGRKLTLPKLVDAMDVAATIDLRGQEDLPLALAVIGKSKDPQVKRAVSLLRGWVRSGAHRRDKDGDGKYDDAQAVQIMDAWWPRWLKAEFEPALGSDVYDHFPHGIDDTPNGAGSHHGSSYMEGWYGYAAKDLRQVLGRPVAQKYAVTFCGGGSRAKCRNALVQSLKAALAVPASELYSGDSTCKDAGRDGDQTCWDAIHFQPLGAVTQPLIPWQNRPTYQQAVEIAGHRP